MTDDIAELIERLGARQATWMQAIEVMNEAATTIRALAEENERLRKQISKDAVERRSEEVDRLNARIRQIEAERDAILAKTIERCWQVAKAWSDASAEDCQFASPEAAIRALAHASDKRSAGMRARLSQGNRAT